MVQDKVTQTMVAMIGHSFSRAGNSEKVTGYSTAKPIIIQSLYEMRQDDPAATMEQACDHILTAINQKPAP